MQNSPRLLDAGSPVDNPLYYKQECIRKHSHQHNISESVESVAMASTGDAVSEVQAIRESTVRGQQLIQIGRAIPIALSGEHYGREIKEHHQRVNPILSNVSITMKEDQSDTNETKDGK